MSGQIKKEEEIHSLFKEAVDLAVKNNNALLIYKVANKYRYGNGVEKHLLKAKTFYEKAADLGSVDALNKLAEMYEKGKGVQQDPKKALEFREEAQALTGKYWRAVPVELSNAGEVRPAKSIITHGNDGETTVKTDCSTPSLCQIRTLDFNVTEGNYRVSCGLKLEGTKGLDFAVFNPKTKGWLTELPHLKGGEYKVNETFAVPKGVTNLSMVFYTKQKGSSFDFTLKDLKIEKEENTKLISMQLD